MFRREKVLRIALTFLLPMIRLPLAAIGAAITKRRPRTGKRTRKQNSIVHLPIGITHSRKPNASVTILQHLQAVVHITNQITLPWKRGT